MSPIPSRDALLDEREALRSLDRRLLALAADIEEIVPSGRRGPPIGYSPPVGDSAAEHGALEELAEIAAGLRALGHQDLPEIDVGGGPGLTFALRQPKLRSAHAQLDRIVHARFEVIESQLPPRDRGPGLADAEPYRGEIPGDLSSRLRFGLTLACVVALFGGMVLAGTVDMSAVDRVCERPVACASSEPRLEIFGGGTMIRHGYERDCTTPSRMLFDADGELLDSTPAQGGSSTRWPRGPSRGAAACEQREQLRWTFIGFDD